MNTPLVGIVILNYNTYLDTLKLVDELHVNLNYEKYTIIVVDNASPNESADILEQKSEDGKFVFIKNDENTGYAAGNNVGIKYSNKIGAKYSWILNNDIILSDKDCLKKMVALMEQSDRIGVVNPRIIKADKSEDLQYYERPSIWDMSFGCFSYRKRRRNYKSEKDFVIYRPHGCCMLLSNSIMEDIDYMDERTFLYCEEELLAERLLRVNCECWCCADTNVIHNHSQTTYTVLKKKGIVKNTIDSYKIYLRDYRGVSNPLLYGLIVLVKALITYRSY